jgi:hypothetical protein
MGIIIRQGIVALLIMIFTPLAVCGSWDDSKVVVEGFFGETDNQFGFAHGYIVNVLPEVLAIFNDGQILLWDSVQGKTKLFDKNGLLTKSLPYIGLLAKEASSDSVYAFKFESSDKASYIGVYNISENKWVWFDNSKNFIPSGKALAVKSGDNLIVWKEKGTNTHPLVSSSIPMPRNLLILVLKLSGAGLRAITGMKRQSSTRTSPIT